MPGIVICIKNSFAVSQLLGKHLISFDSLLYLLCPIQNSERNKASPEPQVISYDAPALEKGRIQLLGVRKLVLVQVENNEDL